MKRVLNAKFISIMLVLSISLAGCGVKSVTQAVTENVVKAETSKKSNDDAIRWFNASYAILTKLNGNDYTLYGGVAINEQNTLKEKLLLERDWGVTDRKSADETLDWALNEGHRSEFAELMEMFDAMGLSEVEHSGRLFWLIEEVEMEPEEAAQFIDFYEAYENKGAGAIDAWDYSRALNLCSFYYAAGYYTKEEALDKSLEIAKIVQPIFASWDEYVDSYLLGYEFWAQESPEKRRQIYEELKAGDDNPYSVDFKANLVKNW
ncbi:MAG: DUF1266 domain-containing protein [Lachnospiraceae bacterium]|nr:DUF1266 domain-containing protein [Lachnospiraceae bacterium]